MPRGPTGIFIIGLILLLGPQAARLAAQVEPEFARALQLHQAGDLAGAAAAYQAFLKEHPDSVKAHSNLGVVYARTGKYQEAIEEYTRALQLDEENAAVRFNLALAYYDSAQIRKAAVEFETVVSAQPENEKAAVLLGDCRLRMGDYRKVIEVLGPREAAHGDDAALAYVLGTALIRDQQAERGQALIDRILRQGESAQAHLMLGTAAMMGRDYKQAAAEFARAMELNPALPSAHGLYGRAIMAAGDTAQAMEAFQAELRIDATDFESNLYLGVLLKKEQRFEEALPHLHRALEVRPGAADVRYQIATLELARGRYEEARTTLEELVREAPEFLEAHVSLATAYYRLKRKQEGDRENAIVRRLTAERDAKAPAAAASSPPAGPAESFDSVSQRAEAAREADRGDEALALYQKAVGRKPDWAEGWWYVGTLLYERDRFAEALPVFQKVTELKPKGGPAWAMLGLCEFELQRYREAAIHLQQARGEGLPKSRLKFVAVYHYALLLNRFAQAEIALQLLYGLAREGESPQIVEALGLAALSLPYLPKELPADKRDLVEKVGRAEQSIAERNMAEAGRRFDEALRAYPRTPGVHYAHGVFLMPSDTNAALAEFRREIGLSPRHVNARLQIAFEYIKRADYAAGLSYAEEAVKLAPELFGAHNALGRILLETGQTARAIAELETGLKLAPDSPETCYALARAYARAGRKQDAARARAEFSRLDKLRRSLSEGHGTDAVAQPPG